MATNWQDIDRIQREHYIPEVVAVMGRRHHQARAWLVNHFDEPGWCLLDDAQTFAAIQRHYEGGWAQFVTDHD